MVFLRYSIIIYILIYIYYIQNKIINYIFTLLKKPYCNIAILQYCNNCNNCNFFIYHPFNISLFSLKIFPIPFAISQRYRNHAQFRSACACYRDVISTTIRDHPCENTIYNAFALTGRGTHNGMTITQGAASLCPGLCAFAISGRAWTMCFCHFRAGQSHVLLPFQGDARIVPSKN